LSFNSNVEDALAGSIEEQLGESQSYVVRPVGHRNVVGQGFGITFCLIQSRIGCAGDCCGGTPGSTAAEIRVRRPNLARRIGIRVTSTVDPDRAARRADRDDDVVSCRKLAIIGCQPQCISADCGELRSSDRLRRVAEGYGSRTAYLLPTVSYRSIGLAVICGRAIQSYGISRNHDRLIGTCIYYRWQVHVIERSG